ncbi:MAG: NAD(P)-dependent oxidoreductase [Actinomycetota bacterium]
MATVGVIGLGAMGGRMARRFLDAGHDVVVWNRSSEKAAPLADAGAQVVETPRDVVRAAEVTLTMLADPDALRAVVEGSDGIAAALDDDKTVIEMSTVGPDALAWLASALPDGANVLDAPVLGSIGEVEAGTLKVFIGGPEQLAQRWTPLLSELGTPMYVGPLGSGAAAKLVVNSTLFGVLGILGEAVALADGLGLPRDTALDALAQGPIGPQVERRRSAIENHDYPRRFALELALKDANLVADAAAAAHVDMRLASAALSWLSDAIDSCWNDKDYSALVAWILKERG